MAQFDGELERAVGGLLTEFAWRVDEGRGDTVAELFTDDATVVTPHFSLEGRPAIHEWFSTRATLGRVSRHFWSNLRLTTEDGALIARAGSLTLVGSAPAPSQGARLSAGISRDRIVFVEGRALFASRELTLSFEGSIAAPEVAP
jgi:hypothetical protein